MYFTRHLSTNHITNRTPFVSHLHIDDNDPNQNKSYSFSLLIKGTSPSKKKKIIITWNSSLNFLIKDILFYNKIFTLIGCNYKNLLNYKRYFLLSSFSFSIFLLLFLCSFYFFLTLERGFCSSFFYSHEAVPSFPYCKEYKLTYMTKVLNVTTKYYESSNYGRLTFTNKYYLNKPRTNVFRLYRLFTP